VVISRTRCKTETLLLHTMKRKWYTYDLSNSSNPYQLQRLSRSCTYCESFQMGFFVQMCSSWNHFNWHSTSHGRSATAERLLTQYQCAAGRQTYKHTYKKSVTHNARHSSATLTNKWDIITKVILQQAASPLHTDGSMVFSSWRQCAPHLIHASLGPPESKSHMASRLVQPFLHSWRQSIPIINNGPPSRPFLPKITNSHGGN